VEFALTAGLACRIEEDRLPVADPVRGMAEILGLDPLYLANEGKLVAFSAPANAPAVLDAMRADPCGREAVVIGECLADAPGRVVLQTRIGGSRIVDMLAGEQLPRIC
jgi:hydrogenase expression/formation protein HypE